MIVQWETILFPHPVRAIRLLARTLAGRAATSRSALHDDDFRVPQRKPAVPWRIFNQSGIRLPRRL